MIRLPGVFILPNHTFLDRFGGKIRRVRCQVIVGILARCNRAKIHIARPEKPKGPSKGTKKVRSDISRTQID